MAGERGDLAGELLKPRLDSADRRVAEPADAWLSEPATMTRTCRPTPERV